VNSTHKAVFDNPKSSDEQVKNAISVISKTTQFRSWVDKVVERLQYMLSHEDFHVRSKGSLAKIILGTFISGLPVFTKSFLLEIARVARDSYPSVISLENPMYHTARMYVSLFWSNFVKDHVLATNVFKPQGVITDISKTKGTTTDHYTRTAVVNASAQAPPDSRMVAAFKDQDLSSQKPNLQASHHRNLPRGRGRGGGRPTYDRRNLSPFHRKLNYHLNRSGFEGEFREEDESAPADGDAPPDATAPSDAQKGARGGRGGHRGGSFRGRGTKHY